MEDTVLFLHGFALDGRLWRPQLAVFPGGVAPDLPGFGAAPKSGQSAARAVAASCEGPVHVVGLSLGGAVAVDFALAFPERVRSLTLIDAVLKGRPTGIRAFEKCSALAREGKLAEATEAWLADPLFDGPRRKPAVFAALREMARDYRGEHWAGRASTSFEVADPAARLGSIAVPALVIAGADDLPTFRAMSDEYAAALPRARKIVLEGVGHLANLEAPEAVNAALSEHFAAA